MLFIGQENSVWFLCQKSFTNYDQMIFVDGEKRERADHVLQLQLHLFLQMAVLG